MDEEHDHSSDEQEKDEKDNAAYKENFAKLYPFAVVDFTAQESHDGEFVIAKPQEEHEWAAPEECDPCKELKKKLEENQRELDALREHHDSHHRRRN